MVQHQNQFEFYAKIKYILLKTFYRFFTSFYKVVVPVLKRNSMQKITTLCLYIKYDVQKLKQFCVEYLIGSLISMKIGAKYL